MVGVVGDFDKPLGDFPAFHLGVAAPAAAVDDLLVGQHGFVVGAPVHCRGLFVDQAFFVEAGEEPLFPTVVVGLAGGQFAVPVVGKAQLLELAAHVVDVFHGPLGGRGVVFHRCVLGGQAEGIPAHGLQNIFAQHALITGDHIGNAVVANVPHVQLATGVGEHGQAVVFLAALVLDSGEAALLLPVLLDAGFNIAGGIVVIHWRCGLCTFIEKAGHFNSLSPRRPCDLRGISGGDGSQWRREERRR